MDVTGTAQDYLSKKNLIETPNVDVCYNSILIDFRAMANEQTDKITINIGPGNIDERYYIIQFCDLMGYDIIPLTPGSDGIIQDSSAISSKSNTMKRKKWTVVSPLYTGPLDAYTIRMPSRQAYVMHRVHVNWDTLTGCTSTAQPNNDYLAAEEFLNAIKWTFPSDMKNSSPSNPNATNDLLAFNQYYPNIATNGTTAEQSLQTYNALGISGPLDPRDPNVNIMECFSAFVWYANNQILNVPTWWDTNLSNLGFDIANSSVRNSVAAATQVVNNDCSKIITPSGTPCINITASDKPLYKISIAGTLRYQIAITEKTGEAQPGNWISSSTFTVWMDQDPSTDSHYDTEKAYLMFDRTWIYIFANIPYDALYFSTSSTLDGTIFNSANEYQLVIKANNWPTTAVSQGWWSIVSYDKDNFYNNVDCKFSVGSAQMPEGFDTTKPYDQDITIIFTPQPEKYQDTENTLILGTPPIATDFYTVFRIYAPSGNVISCKWKPQAVSLRNSSYLEPFANNQMFY